MTMFWMLKSVSTLRMLGLHITTMHYECYKFPFVTDDHKFDLNLMVRTRGFTNCRDLLRLIARISCESSRIMTHSHEYCPALLRFTERHCELLRSITFCYECYEPGEFDVNLYMAPNSPNNYS